MDDDYYKCNRCGKNTIYSDGLCPTCTRKCQQCKSCGTWMSPLPGGVCRPCVQVGEAALLKECYHAGIDHAVVAERVNKYRAEHGPASGRHLTLGAGGVIFKYAQVGLISQQEAEEHFAARNKAKARQRSKERSPGWAKARKQVFERDGKKCAVCGNVEGIQVHHIDEYSKVKKHDLWNLIALCRGCHKVFGNQRIYVNPDAYQEQFESLLPQLLKYESIIAKLGWRLRVVCTLNSHADRSSILVRALRLDDQRPVYMCTKHYHLVLADETSEHTEEILQIPASSKPVLLVAEQCEHGRGIKFHTYERETDPCRGDDPALANL